MAEFIKENMYEDLTKVEIRELFNTEYPNVSKEDFEILYSHAFTEL